MVLIEPQPNMVLIIADKVAEESAGGMVIPETAREKLQKAQSRGTVYNVGGKVEWPAKGDYVSFYRNAATPITEGDIEYLVIHDQHILAKFTNQTHVEK